MYLDGGSNVTRNTSHWWGHRAYMSRTVANREILAMRTAATRANFAGWAAAKFTKGISAAFGTIFNAHMNNMANAMQRRLLETTNRGIVLDLHFTSTFVTRAQ